MPHIHLMSASALLLSGLLVASPGALAAAPETELFEALEAHLQEHAESTQAGFYPDGTKLEPHCEDFGYTVCVADAFMRAHDDRAAAITAQEALDSDARLIIDVRGAPEQEWIDLGDAAAHEIQFGDEAWDPAVVGPLDRELFAELALEAIGDPDQPVAVLCTAGVRSRAAAAALREAGFSDVRNIADGVVGGPAGPGMAAALGVEIPPPPEAEQE